MAHYAFLDENNIVTEVIVGIDETELIEGLDPEIWYGNLRGQTCKRTSFNTVGGKHLEGGTPFRANFAGVGFTYDEYWDSFIPPQPFPSWKLNYENFLWEAPVKFPEEDTEYLHKWSEVNKQWVRTGRKEI